MNFPYIPGNEGAKGAKSPPHTFRTFRTPAALGIQKNCATGKGALYER